VVPLIWEDEEDIKRIIELVSAARSVSEPTSLPPPPAAAAVAVPGAETETGTGLGDTDTPAPTIQGNLGPPAPPMYIIASDCVYGDKSSESLADLLRRLLIACPHATVLLAFERRPLHSAAKAVNRDFSAEFFNLVANMPGLALTEVHDCSLTH